MQKADFNFIKCCKLAFLISVFAMICATQCLPGFANQPFPSRRAYQGTYTQNNGQWQTSRGLDQSSLNQSVERYIDSLRKQEDAQLSLAQKQLLFENDQRLRQQYETRLSILKGVRNSQNNGISSRIIDKNTNFHYKEIPAPVASREYFNAPQNFSPLFPKMPSYANQMELLLPERRGSQRLVSIYLVPLSMQTLKLKPNKLFSLDEKPVNPNYTGSYQMSTLFFLLHPLLFDWRYEIESGKYRLAECKYSYSNYYVSRLYFDLENGSYPPEPLRQFLKEKYFINSGIRQCPAVLDQ
ncbi:MAG: hypothetical protein SFZ03_10270 [Candidatus Melainabacteria bacterium]|nr:hypothetical protein [Candidatus Melainabacteria bacterium]